MYNPISCGIRICFLGALCLFPFRVMGQMVTTGFPLVGAREGFSEGFRSNWALTGPGIYSWFNNNSGSGIPQFGGFTPNAGLSGGFGVNGGGVGANLGFNFAQGSSRSMVSNTPIVTGFAGQPMLFQNSLQRPFVTNLIPNVGNVQGLRNLGAVNPIRARLQNGEFRMENGKVVAPGGLKPRTLAETQATRVASNGALVDAAPPTRSEREAQQSAEEVEKRLAIRKYIQKGEEAEAKGKANVAKQYYQLAARRAEGDLKQEALASLNRLTNE